MSVNELIAAHAKVANGLYLLKAKPGVRFDKASYGLLGVTDLAIGLRDDEQAVGWAEVAPCKFPWRVTDLRDTSLTDFEVTDYFDIARSLDVPELRAALDEG